VSVVVERRIARVTARALNLTPERPTETAAGTMTTTPLVLVDVLTDDGLTGHAYLRTYTPVALGPLALLVGELGEVLGGRPAEPAGVEATLRRQLRLLGTAGLAGLALAGLDMALWDVLAQAARMPLAALLGGRPRPVPAYASLRTMRPDAAAAEAEELVAAGFTAVKVKLGRAGLAQDVATIRAVRRAIGDTATLMVDYNQSLTVPEAIARIRALDGEGLEWVEEPTDADDVDGHARIRHAVVTPIQVGENWSAPSEVARSIAAGASDYATLDAMKLGGVTGWLRAAAIAGAARVPVSSHSFGEVSAHLLAVTPTAHWFEHLDHVGPILVEPLPVRDGHAIASSAPGNGLRWDEDRIAHELARSQ
jgi:mandelate racemase